MARPFEYQEDPKADNKARFVWHTALSGPDLRGNSQAPNCYGCCRNVNIAEARSTGFSRKDKCPEGISALFAVGIKSANA
jgi:hypothetical protein